MAKSFYFYDLETSGINSSKNRIMQFGGQRTDMDLKPVGEPDNILIKLTDDVLPEPDAILIHGITPQKTKAEGINESQFAKYLITQVSTPDTTIVGFNNIRFDNNFIRFLLWRNFYDAYEWTWKNGCSTWDLLDVVRMCRALRPEGIKWPFDSAQGKPSNRLELLASINKLDHDSAHDALSDVHASIAVARMIRNKQPKLFDYLLNLRDKTKVEALVGKGDPVIYTSGRYPSELQKTTIAVAITPHPEGRGMFMYDLRVDPAEFIKLSASELAAKWSARGEDAPYFPVKLLSYNKSPAIAPLSVLDDASTARLQLDREVIAQNLQQLRTDKIFGQNVASASGIVYPKHRPELVIDEQRVDEQLYDGFVNGVDKTKRSVVRAADPEQLADLRVDFTDDRLKLLLPLYKARNFPQNLSADERALWEKFKTKRLLGGGQASPAARYFKRIEELGKQPRMSKEQKYLLDELKLYGESILPPT
ncbi:MAG: exodeoxyribonuclease I [bacterium]|nr:exodeoxyribonuclease I [bacterium]